jgi:hypothetical protein
VQTACPGGSTQGLRVGSHEIGARRQSRTNPLIEFSQLCVLLHWFELRSCREREAAP